MTNTVTQSVIATSNYLTDQNSIAGGEIKIKQGKKKVATEAAYVSEG